ncbi:hypothetical protein ES703_113664 [subsurface metagenome]
MVTREDSVKVWPRTKGGRPLFKTTNEAILYAQLTWDDERAIHELDFYHDKLREKIKELRENEQPDLEKLMRIATQAQLFRECIEEVGRIMVEPFPPPLDI